jgi:hypothetical protein
MKLLPEAPSREGIAAQRDPLLVISRRLRAKPTIAPPMTIPGEITLSIKFVDEHALSP